MLGTQRCCRGSWRYVSGVQNQGCQHQKYTCGTDSCTVVFSVMRLRGGGVEFRGWADRAFRGLVGSKVGRNGQGSLRERDG